MLRVTVEIVPFGCESAKKIIGQYHIINTGKHAGSPVWGNYRVEAIGGQFLFYVKNHLRSKGYELLLKRVFAGLVRRKWSEGV